MKPDKKTIAPVGRGLLFTLLIFTVMTMQAQFPAEVRGVDLVPGRAVSVEGSLSQGSVLNDLSWAWSSSNACFPETQKEWFTGSHVLYHAALPPRSVLTVTLVPARGAGNMSLYGYQIGATRHDVVPALASCVSCEADHERPGHNGPQRSIRFNATTNPYNIVIGVAGARGLQSGDYTLTFTLEGGETELPGQEKVKVYRLQCEKGKVTTVEGHLAEGVLIHDLSWAWSSSNACFPETQNDKFTGRHVLYTTVIPRYSKMTIELIPARRKDNFSLYAYETGVDANRFVPDLPSCVTCEADYKWDYPHRGARQGARRTVELQAVNNPYQVVIGVAGAGGLEEGDFTLKITVTGR